MTGARWGVGLLVAVLALSGCERGEDDELAPRPTPSPSATPSPTLRPPAQVPLGGADWSSADVVWAHGSTLHVGSRTVDLAPVAVERVVATPTGAYVLARGELWSVDLRRAEGTRLPRVERVGLARDGGALLVDLAGDRGRRAYDLVTGRLRPGPAPAPLTRADQRRGPGDYTVARAADGSPEVTDADGAPVDVVDLPERFTHEVWPTRSSVVGVATAADGSTVVRCGLDATDGDQARCTTLGDVTDDQDVVFAVAALPG